MKLTKFLNNFAAERGQAGNDFQKIKLFRKAKCHGNQFRKVSQLEYSNLFFIGPDFLEKAVFFEKQIPKIAILQS